MIEIRKIFIAVAFIFFSAQVNAGDIANVSLLNLISMPEKYDGKLVRVEGYLHQKYEDNGLYISKEAADYMLSHNAVWLTYGDSLVVQHHEASKKLNKKDMKEFDGSYVLIEGVFRAAERGHMGMYAGGIDNVSRIMQISVWYDGKRRLK
jgi:hypothetical protein